MRKTRNFKKTFKITQKRRSNKRIKLVGGDDDECPVCLEPKEQATMRPCGHKMCMDCFSRMTKKICPLCRSPIEQMIKFTSSDTGEQIETKIWPEQLDIKTVKQNINIIMDRRLQNIPNISWLAWATIINKQGAPIVQEFKEQLLDLNEIELRQTYKHFRTYLPPIIFLDVAKEFVKYYKKLTGEKIKVTVSTKMDANLIREFLAYTLVVELPINDYKNRINRLFGWPTD